jgi:hypothetical protein
VRSNWLPFLIEIAVDPVTFSVTVTEGGTEDTKETVKSNESSVSGSADGISKSRTLYELTAMVAHVHDEFEADRPFLEENEGHLVAHLKIPPSYTDFHGGIALSSPGPG